MAFKRSAVRFRLAPPIPPFKTLSRKRFPGQPSGWPHSQSQFLVRAPDQCRRFLRLPVVGPLNRSGVYLVILTETGSLVGKVSSRA